MLFSIMLQSLKKKNIGKLLRFRQKMIRFRVETTTGKVSVERYFLTKYNQRLSYPDLPLVCEHTSRGINFYPAELLSVCENQRVTQSQQSADQVQKMIRVRMSVLMLRKFNRETSSLRSTNRAEQNKLHEWLGQHLIC